MYWIIFKVVGLTVVLLLVLSSLVHAQQPVELSLIVTDKSKKSIVNAIGKDEVRVIEDKVEQTVLSVERDERPIDYGLIIDSSSSLRSFIAPAVEAAKLLIINRRPSDEIFIERFISSDQIQKLHDFSNDNNALLESLKLIKVEGGQSAIVDALYIATEHVAQHSKTRAGRRKALVIITDGEERNSLYKVDQLLKLLREEGIQVFVIGLTMELDREAGLVRRSPRDKAEKFLNSIAEETGGQVFFPTTAAELPDAAVQVNSSLRSQFRINYQSTQQDRKGFRKVEVKLTSPRGEKRKAIVPRGYYAGTEKR